MNRVVLILFIMSFFAQAVKTQDLAENYHLKGADFQERAIYSRAIDYYTIALEKNAMLHKSRYNRAVVFFQIQKYNKSLLDIQKLLAFQPDDPNLYSLMGLIHAKQQKPTEALHYIDQAIDLQDRPIFHLQKADILLQNKHPELAFNELAFVIENPDLEVAALELRATAYLDLHQPNQALRVYDHLLELQPKAEFFFNRGILYKRMGRPNQACNDFSEAAKESFFLEALQELIQCQWLLNDIESIHNTVKNGISHFPNEPIFYKYAGLANLKEGNHELAIQWFDKAIKLGAQEIDIYINKGIALLPTDKDKAKESFLHALKIDPDNVIAKHNIKVLAQ